MPLVFGKPIRFGVLSMAYKCAICETRVYRPDRYFCWRCYKDFRDDIREKKEWTRFVVSEEAKRRREERRDAPMLIYLGDKWDIDTRGRLILRREGFYHGR